MRDKDKAAKNKKKKKKKDSATEGNWTRRGGASLLGQRINLEIEQYLRTTAVPAVILRCHSSGVESWGRNKDTIDMDSKVKACSTKGAGISSKLQTQPNGKSGWSNWHKYLTRSRTSNTLAASQAKGIEALWQRVAALSVRVYTLSKQTTRARDRYCQTVETNETSKENRNNFKKDTANVAGARHGESNSFFMLCT